MKVSIEAYVCNDGIIIIIKNLIYKVFFLLFSQYENDGASHSLQAEYFAGWWLNVKLYRQYF